MTEARIEHSGGPSHYDEAEDSHHDQEREDTPERSENQFREPGHVSGALKVELRALISEEMGRAQEASIPLFLIRINEAINQAISEEFRKRDGNTLVQQPRGGAAHIEIPAIEARAAKDKFSYKEFSACRPPEFEGEKDPIISMRWLSEVEGAFKTCECPDRLKVTFASNLLRKRGKEWWDLLNRTKGSEVVDKLTWAEFKEIFVKNFSPEAELKKIRREFLNMKQTSQSVNEFTGIFLDRARFCPEYMENESRLMDHYHEMLRKDIREFVNPSRCQTLDQLVNEARERELETRRHDVSSPKRKAEQSNTPFKKQKTSAGKREERRDFPVCGTCSKRHPGVCHAGTKACFRCGRLGHIGRDCPDPLRVCFNCMEPGHLIAQCPKIKSQGGGHEMKKNFEKKTTDLAKPKGRSFQITTEEAKHAPDVITGETSGSRRDLGKALM